MNGLEKITQRITDDAREKAAELEAQAKAQAAETPYLRWRRRRSRRAANRTQISPWLLRLLTKGISQSRGPQRRAWMPSRMYWVSSRKQRLSEVM